MGVCRGPEGAAPPDWKSGAYTGREGAASESGRIHECRDWFEL